MNPSKRSELESTANTQLESLLDEYAVAKFYGVSVATIRRWRWLHIGPTFHKIGALCRYRMADLEAYLRSTRTGGRSQTEGR
ncbi:MAG: helix-turn-helix domain-containing protein [Bryobacteraceae bacterium]